MTNGGSKTVRSNKASAARTGKKRVLSDEARRKISEAFKREREGAEKSVNLILPRLKRKCARLPHIGKKRSDEFRETMRRIALADKRKPPSQLGKTWKQRIHND